LSISTNAKKAEIPLPENPSEQKTVAKEMILKK
jgi:hypothetical protein